MNEGQIATYLISQHCGGVPRRSSGHEKGKQCIQYRLGALKALRRFLLGIVHQYYQSQISCKTHIQDLMNTSVVSNVEGSMHWSVHLITYSLLSSSTARSLIFIHSIAILRHRWQRRDFTLIVQVAGVVFK